MALCVALCCGPALWPYRVALLHDPVPCGPARCSVHLALVETRALGLFPADVPSLCAQLLRVLCCPWHVLQDFGRLDLPHVGLSFSVCVAGFLHWSLPSWSRTRSGCSQHRAACSPPPDPSPLPGSGLVHGTIPSETRQGQPALPGAPQSTWQNAKSQGGSQVQKQNLIFVALNAGRHGLDFR